MGKVERITDNLFIKDLIRKVHDELLASQEEREKKGIEPLFYVKDMTIEANFIAEKSAKADGGISFKFLTVDAHIGGEGKIQAQQVHKITLNLVTEATLSLKKTTRKDKLTDFKSITRMQETNPLTNGANPLTDGVNPLVRGGMPKYIKPRNKF